MRIYTDFPQAFNEIRRDLSEMGINVHPKTWQDKQVEDDPGFDSKELQDYMYMVTRPDLRQLSPTTPWADEEWRERLMGITGSPVNPGDAWQSRAEIWTQFMQPNGRFGYSYSERFAMYEQVRAVAQRLIVDPDTRQAFISVWDPSDVENLGGVSRVPCTLGYVFKFRQGALNMLYIQRSADFHTHFENDVYLAGKMHKYMAEITGYPLGHFSHLIMSLHIFQKDVQGVF